jgi:hypothetical protein
MTLQKDNATTTRTMRRDKLMSNFHLMLEVIQLWHVQYLKWLFVKFLIYHILMVISMKKPICDIIIIKTLS